MYVLLTCFEMYQNIRSFWMQKIIKVEELFHTQKIHAFHF